MEFYGDTWNYDYDDFSLSSGGNSSSNSSLELSEMVRVERHAYADTGNDEESCSNGSYLSTESSLVESHNVDFMMELYGDTWDYDFESHSLSSNSNDSMKHSSLDSSNPILSRSSNRHSQQTNEELTMCDISQHSNIPQVQPDVENIVLHIEDNNLQMPQYIKHLSLYQLKDFQSDRSFYDLSVLNIPPIEHSDSDADSDSDSNIESAEQNDCDSKFQCNDEEDSIIIKLMFEDEISE